MAIIHLDGQQWTLPDAVAQNDAQLKQALRAVAPQVGDPKFERKQEGDTLHVTVTKQAGPKGGGTALDLRNIRTDGGTQARAGLNPATVAEYAEALETGAQLPPVIVFHDGSENWLGDGFHRFAAYQQLAQKSARWHQIPAETRMGTRRDAVLYAVGANADHGLPRTNADKHRAVLTLLNDPDWTSWSDGQIAKAARVSQPFVSTLRRERASQNGSEMPQARTVTRGDQTYSYTPPARPTPPSAAAPLPSFQSQSGGMDPPDPPAATTFAVAPAADPPPVPIPVPLPPVAAEATPLPVPIPVPLPPVAAEATPLPVPIPVPLPPALPRPGRPAWADCPVQVTLQLLPAAGDGPRDVLISAVNSATQAVAFGAELVSEEALAPLAAPIAAVLNDLRGQHPAEALT